jgi:hypothetical protein
MNKLLDTYTLLRLNNEETENMNRTIKSNEIESVIQSFSSGLSEWLKW